MAEEQQRYLHWTPEHELVLAEWADKAMCYRWMHMKSHGRYQFLHNCFTIPVIVMSTLTGTANFAQEKLPEKYQFYAPVVIGSINLIAGIITTVQQFLHISDLKEGHRISTIAWDKFYRKIKVELSKAPVERLPVGEFFLSASEEYDRLMETSPSIDANVMSSFKTTFDGTFTKNDVRALYNDLVKPEVLDSLITVKRSIYKLPQHIIQANILKTLPSTTTDPSIDIIDQFYQRFTTELSRPPTRDELIDNLIRDANLVSEEMVDGYLERYTSIATL
jgi:hypothetical protein